METLASWENAYRVPLWTMMNMDLMHIGLTGYFR